MIALQVITVAAAIAGARVIRVLSNAVVEGGAEEERASGHVQPLWPWWGAADRVTQTNTLVQPFKASTERGPVCAEHPTREPSSCSRCGSFFCRACAEGSPEACAACRERQSSGLLPSLSRRARIASVLILVPLGLDMMFGILGTLFRYIPLVSESILLDVYCEPIRVGVAALGILKVLCIVGSVVAFLGWLHLAVKAANAKGVDIGLSPGWAVGWWFVPLANLFKPFQVVRDLLVALGGEEVARNAGVVCWWLILLVFGFLRYVALELLVMNGYWLGNCEILIVSVLGLASALLAVNIMRAINWLLRRDATRAGARFATLSASQTAAVMSGHRVRQV